jgi:hypothetical protein
LLDPEVWEHSSDYKPPPADATSISPSVSASVVPAILVSLPNHAPFYNHDCDATATYVRLYPSSRDLDIVGEGWEIAQRGFHDPTVFDGLVTAASLPSSVTDSRLSDLLDLQRNLEFLESNQDHYGSMEGGEDYCEPGLPEARAAYAAAKESLLNDLYGPPPSSAGAASLEAEPVLPAPDTLYLFFNYGPERFTVVGTYTELLHTAISLGEPCDVKWLLRGYLTAADLGLPNSLLQRYTELWGRLSKELSLSTQTDIWPVPMPEDDLTPLVTEFNSIRETVMKAYNG